MKKSSLMSGLNKNVSILNNSKLFAGIVMILLNIGSKQIIYYCLILIHFYLNHS